MQDHTYDSHGDCRRALNESKKIQRAEKNILIKEIQKNKELRDKIIKLRKKFEDRAIHFKSVVESNTLSKELLFNTNGHLSESNLVIFEIDKLFPPGSLDNIGGNRLDS
jgi:hypothetical protein